MRKYITLLIFVALTLFTGCNGLDLFPKDTISDETFWKTDGDYKLAANNLYRSLEDFDYESADFNYNMDTESDIAFDVPNSISNGSYQPVEVDNAHWTYPWDYIRRCNNIMEKASVSPISEDIKEFVAEAKFFRAYNYWKMFRLYGELPIITKVLDVKSPELYSSRATRKETVDFILQDLTEAAAALPKQDDLSSGDIGRITQGAALGLKARVALFEGTWDEFRNDSNAKGYLDIAIEAASEVMNSSQYSLYTGMGAQSYRYLFIDEGDDCSECILDHRYARDINGHIFNRWISEGNYLVTKKLADMYLCTDGLPVAQSPLFQGYETCTSEFQNRDPRMSMTIIVPGTPVAQTWYVNPVASWPFYPQRNANTGYTTYKHLSEDSYANALNYNWSYDNHILRYAEVLLIYAEATYERNGAISDEDLNKSINLIRQRVNMPNLTNAFVASSGLNMRNEIRRERTVELALEGFRYDDLRRWKTAETELSQAIKGVKIVGTQWADPVVIEGVNRNPYADESWQNATDENGFIVAEEAAARRFDPEKHYLRPIPTKEILINPNLRQNPNW